MQKKGILTVISGFSGAGKGTLVNELMSRYDNYALSISVTTREPRDKEQHGKDYFFISEEEFEKMIAKDELIEYARYVGQSYGTPRNYVEQKLEEGKDVILEIEMQGALQVKEKFPQTLMLFVTPPSAQILKDRLVGRGTESMEKVEKRMKQAVNESKNIDKYDYLLLNDNLETCVKETHEIIQKAHNRCAVNEEFICKIQKELKEISEA